MTRKQFTVAAAIFLACTVVAYGFGLFAPLIGKQSFRIPNDSMEPGILKGSVVVICLRKYKNQPPAPGDVIAFRVPGDEEIIYLNRVAAAGGSSIGLVAGAVIVDGKKMDAPFWVAADAPVPYMRDMSPTIVPAGMVYALGDNLDRSLDSRRVGPVPMVNVIGGTCAQQQPQK